MHCVVRNLVPGVEETLARANTINSFATFDDGLSSAIHAPAKNKEKEKLRLDSSGVSDRGWLICCICLGICDR